MRTGRFLILVAAALVVLHATTVLARDPVIEAEETAQEAMRDHCDGLLHARVSAARVGRWREVINLGRSFAETCRSADDRFAISRAFEDMGWAALMLSDLDVGLRYVQSCLDSNGLAAGCWARKSQLLFAKGRRQEARWAANRGISVAERAIGVTKVEIAQLDRRRPDLRAEQYLRNRFLRTKEGLELRLDTLSESLSLLTRIQGDLDEE